MIYDEKRTLEKENINALKSESLSNPLKSPHAMKGSAFPSAVVAVKKEKRIVFKKT